MSAKHTPGPWTVDDRFGPQIIIDGSDEWSIATIEGYKSTPPFERKANANLIAASPDLFHALEAMMSANANTTYPPDAPIWNAYRLAKSAIAKAKGEK